MGFPRENSKWKTGIPIPTQTSSDRFIFNILIVHFVINIIAKREQLYF